MLKKIFSHSAIYGIAPQIPKIASLLVLPIITRDLTSNDYGIMGVITAFTGAIAVFAQLGLKVVLVNSFFHSPGQFKWAWRQIYGFLIYWNIIYAFILATLIYFIIPDEAVNNLWTILILNVVPLVAFGPTSILAETYYQVKQQPLGIGVRAAIFGTLTIGLNVLFISYYKMGYMGWFWSTFIGTTIMNFSWWIPLYFKLKMTPVLNFKRKFMWQRLKVSVPTVPHYYSGYLLDSSDKMVMKFMQVGTSNIGNYNFAYTLGSLIKTLGIASGKAISPLLNQAYKEGRDLDARNIIFFLQAFFLACTFLGGLWLKEVFKLMVNNEELATLYPLAIIIMMSYNYRPMYMGANNKLFYKEKTNLLWRVTFSAGLINVILNIVLIPYFGYAVAALTTYAALMFMGYSGFYFRIFKEINPVNYYPLVWLTITIAISILVYYLVEFDKIIKLGISVIIIVFIYLLLRYYNRILKS